MQTFKTEEDHTVPIIVEVFKTNVNSESVALRIIADLKRIFPRINFDLDDCDKILRVESKSGYIEVGQITEVVRSFNRDIDILQ